MFFWEVLDQYIVHKYVFTSVSNCTACFVLESRMTNQAHTQDLNILYVHKYTCNSALFSDWFFMSDCGMEWSCHEFLTSQPKEFYQQGIQLAEDGWELIIIM